MDVDETSPGAEEKPAINVTENGSRRLRIKRKAEEAEAKHTNEDSQQEEIAVVFGTPMPSLLVSGSEDGDNEERVLRREEIRRQLLTSPTIENGNKEENADGNVTDTLYSPDEAQPLKRKRYEVRRSGSDDCLLGFDEESGEAEVQKENEIPEKVQHQKKKDASKSPSQKIKKRKEHTKEETGSPTKTVSNTTAAVEKTAKSSPSTEVTIKPHIVGDGDDTIVNVPSKPLPIPKPTSHHDEFYRKPFEFGWKRELVWRANMEVSKDKADVYFISPNGKKIRTKADILPYLEGELTIDHFCFVREPLGVGQEFEIVRSAKPSSRGSVSAATLAAPPVTMGKRVSKPKGPKGASPPPQGWTPTRALKVNNAALLSSTGSSRHMATSSSNISSPSSRTPKTKRTNSAASTTVTVKPTIAAIREPCSNSCSAAVGQIPQLQCIQCLCLFHHQCVGLNPANCEYRSMDSIEGRAFVCEACLPALETSTAAAATAASTQTPTSMRRGKAKQIENAFPQTIAVVKGKKYVLVSKPLTHTEHVVNDIENDLKQINESIRNSRKQSAASADTSHHHVAVNQAPLEFSNKAFATNFFANVSFAFDALLSIFKYLKVHERPRAAAVCKLWHLAAKDTSLWQQVRMKNSKVSNWMGFTAALRRGETKHLDLRKMLLSNTRTEDIWTDFKEHIGTVCSLEVIDLCKCSFSVVDSLFRSNKNLRVLNALAINDDYVDLQNVGLLKNLEELRLRTCEPSAVKMLQPLTSLPRLTHLSLTSLRNFDTNDVKMLGELVTLKSMELGECDEFDSTFAKVVLPELRQLQRLRLENGRDATCCTLEILDTIAQLTDLTQLELINFDIKPGFDGKLQACSHINKLLLIPTYISQSATTNHIVLSAVQLIADTLKVFTWGVTVELLRVTALYVDQCEESTKKEKHHFDECIPVLNPVPGAPPGDYEEEEDNLSKTDVVSDVPQIEILPLDKVESILGDNLPKTKFSIVKVPYHATTKQQLVE